MPLFRALRTFCLCFGGVCVSGSGSARPVRLFATSNDAALGVWFAGRQTPGIGFKVQNGDLRFCARGMKGTSEFCASLLMGECSIVVASVKARAIESESVGDFLLADDYFNCEAPPELV
jgi:hypothetical protein